MFSYHNHIAILMLIIKLINCGGYGGVCKYVPRYRPWLIRYHMLYDVMVLHMRSHQKSKENEGYRKRVRQVTQKRSSLCLFKKRSNRWAFLPGTICLIAPYR